MILNVLLVEKICWVILSWRGSVWLRFFEKIECVFERIYFFVEWFYNKEFNLLMIKVWRYLSFWNNKYKNFFCVNWGDVLSNFYMDLGLILNNCVFSWWWCELWFFGWMKFFDMIL